MAYSYADNQLNNNTNVYPVAFTAGYTNKNQVVVSTITYETVIDANGIETVEDTVTAVDFEFVDNNTIRVTTDLSSYDTNTVIRVQRIVSKQSTAVDYSSAGTATRADLDIGMKHLLYCIHELADGFTTDINTVPLLEDSIAKGLAFLGDNSSSVLTVANMSKAILALSAIGDESLANLADTLINVVDLNQTVTDLQESLAAAELIIGAISAATTTTAGIARFATSAEVLAGTLTNVAVDPAGVAAKAFTTSIQYTTQQDLNNFKTGMLCKLENDLNHLNTPTGYENSEALLEVISSHEDETYQRYVNGNIVFVRSRNDVAGWNTWVAGGINTATEETYGMVKFAPIEDQDSTDLVVTPAWVKATIDSMPNTTATYHQVTRVSGFTYTNTNIFGIVVFVQVSSSAVNAYVEGRVDESGENWRHYSRIPYEGGMGSITFYVPAGKTYKIVTGSTNITTAAEIY